MKQLLARHCQVKICIQQCLINDLRIFENVYRFYNKQVIKTSFNLYPVLPQKYNVYLEFWVSTPCPWEEVPYHIWICICQFQRLPPFFHQENNHSTIMAGYEIYFGPYCIHTSHNPTPETIQIIITNRIGWFVLILKNNLKLNIQWLDRKRYL